MYSNAEVKDYFILLFINTTCTRMESQHERRLLIINGHNSHFSTKFIKFCTKDKIKLFCLLLHIIYIL